MHSELKTTSSVTGLEFSLRDLHILIIGFFVLLAGDALHAADSIIGSYCSSSPCGNTETILQLIGTTLVIVGIAILAIGILKFIRRRYFSQIKT